MSEVIGTGISAKAPTIQRALASLLEKVEVIVTWEADIGIQGFAGLS